MRWARLGRIADEVMPHSDPTGTRRARASAPKKLTAASPAHHRDRRGPRSLPAKAPPDTMSCGCADGRAAAPRARVATASAQYHAVSCVDIHRDWPTKSFGCRGGTRSAARPAALRRRQGVLGPDAPRSLRARASPRSSRRPRARSAPARTRTHAAGDTIADRYKASRSPMADRGTGRSARALS